MIAYKVVRRLGKGYVSALPHGAYVTYYDLDETSFAPIGQLFAFLNLKDANKFFQYQQSNNDHSKFVILKCKISSYEHAKHIAPYPSAYKAFWETDYPGSADAPDGSIVCPSITPIEEI